ncbi:MAG: hypothetical protein KY464_07125 [Gemmatimonadetes bacterium]|nr:hypothetical protein [Gemmatimonadota bacterium]
MPHRGIRPGDARFLRVRIALFWVAVIVWLTGLLLEIQAMTAVAISILIGAVALGLLARRGDTQVGLEDSQDKEDRHR